MSKTRLIATSGICGAVATICNVLVFFAPFLVLILAVVASVAVVIPLLIDGRNLMYSLLVYLVSSVVGFFVGMGNVVYVAPVVLFCLPFAIVKAYGESVKPSAKPMSAPKITDPFDGSDDSDEAIADTAPLKCRLSTVVRWILYYILLEAGVGLTLLFTWLLTPDMFKQLVSTPWLFGVMLGVTQLIVPMYNLLLGGCFAGTVKLLRKIVK